MVEKLKSDMIEAMKAKEKEKLAVIRAIKAGMDQEHIDKKREINEELLIEVVNKQVKQRKESISEFEKAGRTDLVEKNQSEIDILMNYLPEQLTNEEVINILDEVFNQVNPTSPRDMGKIMGAITPLIKGKADTKEVSNMIKERLNNL